MFKELLDPLAIVGVAVVSALLGVFIKSALTKQLADMTRRDVARSHEENTKALERQAESIRLIERDFVPRRELVDSMQNLEEKLRLRIDAIHTDLERVRESIDRSGRELFARMEMNSALLQYVLTDARPQLPVQVAPLSKSDHV